LSSAALVQAPQPTPAHPHAITAAGEATVHVTSSPSAGEIYIDGKFFGNTPSDISLAARERVVKVTIGGKEWSLTVQITASKIRVHADLTGDELSGLRAKEFSY
jgi:PEGA domain